MTAIHPQLTMDEQAQLKQFVRLVYDMVQSRFIQRVNVQDQTVKFERLENGEYQITAPDYDLEDLRSFLTAFRQIALAKKEPVYLLRIRNIVARYGSNELRVELRQLKIRIVPIIEGRFVGIRFGKNRPGEQFLFTSYELLDALVNGVVFHVDPRHDTAARFMLSSEPWQYVRVILDEIITPVLQACTWLVNVIRVEKYLNEVDFPESEKPT